MDTDDNKSLHVIETTSENKKCNCCTIRGNRILTVTQLVLFVVPLLSVITLILERFEYASVTYIAHIGLVISYTAGLVGIGYIIIKSHNINELVSGYLKNGFQHVHDESEETEATSYGHFIINTFISILGIGDSLLNLSSFVDILLDIINEQYDGLMSLSYLIIELIDESFKCFYHLCLLLFVIYGHYYMKLFKCLAVKTFLFSLSISCFLQWIAVIVQELNHEKEILDIDYIDISLNSNHTVMNSHYDTEMSEEGSSEEEMISSFQSVQRFLFPFGTEYRIMLFIEFLIYYLMNNDNNCLNANCFIKAILKVKIPINFVVHKCYSVFDWFCETTYGIGSRVNRKLPEMIHRYGRQTIFEQVIVLIFMIIGIQLVSLAIIIVFVQDYNHAVNATLVSSIRDISSFVLNMIALLFTVFVCFVLYKRRFLKQTHYMEKTATINTEKEADFLFLIGSNLMLITYNVLLIIAFYDDEAAKIQDYPETIRKLQLLFLSCPIVQSVLQVILMWVIEHKLVLEMGYTRILKLLNFAMWVFETFSVVDKGTYAILEGFYSKLGWEILVVVFLPIAIFYRFHSFVMLIKIKTDDYKSEYKKF